MSAKPFLMMDGNEAAASVAYRTNEVIAIYPITPASPMGELSDQWSVSSRPNLWGAVPDVMEMQSEGGAAGAVHGALQAGALTTTFTASQGLLLMIPDLYKIAGELNAFCLHVAARTVATHALSIFGDHSDVMACRQIGLALLASGSVQEAQDLALVAQASTLQSRIPFLHFFDGFRTSHEVAKIEALTDEDFHALIDEEAIAQHRGRALTPDRPVLRGAAQNPDTFFQAREACNRHYLVCPDIVQASMDRLAQQTGRAYHLFDYFGHPEAERVVVLMGSGGETARETVEYLAARGERVGAVLVRLYRPFDLGRFVEALPATTRSLAVLDRTKEPGAVGEPLYLDVVTALQEARTAGLLSAECAGTVIGGRYGLSSKEFTPGMVKTVLDELEEDPPRNHFTVGIVDDITHTSLPLEAELDIEPEDRIEAVFFGLGADGTVGANKNSVKIIGEGTPHHAQGYFVYDSKKAGAITISHLRFGKDPIRAPYLVRQASFVACHQFEFLERYDVLEYAAPGGTFLLNAPYGPDEVWDHLPREVQQGIVEKGLKFHVIDAAKLARDAGLGGRMNTIMQTAFFAISGVLPPDEAIERIKEAIRKSYESKGEQVVRQNYEAVDRALAGLHAVEVGGRAAEGSPRPPQVPKEAPDLVQRVTALMMANQGDLLPVSAFPVDGTWPLGTTRWEKRNIAQEIPVWDADICIQCNKCALVCPHAAIRAKVYEPEALSGAPDSFLTSDCRGADFKGWNYTIQVAPEDCTGCTICVRVCPAKDRSNPKHKAIDMAPQRPIRDQERENYAFFLDIPEVDRTLVKLDNKGTQLLQPLFEYSGACAGCGETPYIKLLTQLFGDRLLIANATGCSSIYGGNLPTVPYATNADGRGPAWSNSLFEDNAEFGFGMRLAVDSHREQAVSLLRSLTLEVGGDLVRSILDADQGTEAGLAAQRERVERLREILAPLDSVRGRRLEQFADYLVDKSVWLMGGDGWAYDIGFGGLDHVLASTRNVNALVLDTEVYSNTGGQQSKATPMGAAAKFAAAGKETGKKDLGMIAMTYGHVYVARIAFGAKDTQTVKALREAESYPGPSLVIAYSHCIAHGYSMANGVDQQKLAVDSGVWPLFRFDPRRAALGAPPLQVDSGNPKIDPEQYMRNEARFLLARKADPERYKRLLDRARHTVRQRFAVYEQLAKLTIPMFSEDEPEKAAATAGAGEPERKA